MDLNRDLLADFSNLSLDELRQLRTNLDVVEAQLLVKLLDVRGQLDRTTAELVSRYQADPKLALELLPQR
ncbi:MAG: hypothetical protein WAS05_07595 [Candidatus Nanopelagicales bacterium]